LFFDFPDGSFQYLIIISVTKEKLNTSVVYWRCNLRTYLLQSLYSYVKNFTYYKILISICRKQKTRSIKVVMLSGLSSHC
jgi:hypothetical protein